MVFFARSRDLLPRLLSGLLLLTLIITGLLVQSQAQAQTAQPQAVATSATTTMFSWQDGATVPQPRFESQGVFVNGKLYVIGGFISCCTQINATDLVDVYDLASNTWQRIASIPEAISHAPVVADGTNIYVLGGYLGNNPGGSTNHVWKLNTVTNTWTRGIDLPVARGGAGAAIVNRKIYFFGGAVRTAGVFDDTDFGDHYMLDLSLANPTWVSRAAMPNPRNHTAAGVVDGKIYAVGGQHGKAEESANQAEVDRYDPATNTWTRVADMPIPKGHTSSSTFGYRGRLLVIGGSINGGTSGLASADVLMYDPKSDVWMKLVSLPAYRKTPVADVWNNKLVVTTGGGYGQTDTTWIGNLPDSWESNGTMPVPLGEVASGIIGNKMYVVGQGNAATLRYNLTTGSYSSTTTLAQRALRGNHHAAEVINGKFYLFGGLDNNSDGKVQIYDPVSNTWAMGADMPFAAGASSSAVINGYAYVAGGIINGSTTTRVARYDPVANTWTEVAAMPRGRNHAASATDGSKLYVFGGRGPGSGDGNNVANGFDTVQIYDPVANSWRSSMTDTTIAPLPQARGGMGKAVYYDGEFYIFGGETLDGAGAVTGNVYDRVDIYNPILNRWRTGSPMPTARHGIFPVINGGRIYIAGGGTVSGFSQTNITEIYNPGIAADENAHLESNGQVGFDSEQVHGNTARGQWSWQTRNDVDRPGFSGNNYLAVLPNTGTLSDTNYTTMAPQLDYRVKFTTPGTYYVWLRGWADSGGDNSVHLGLNGQQSSSSDKMTLPIFSAWRWFRDTTDGVPSTITIPSAGVYTLNLWMREDGFRVDRLYLTTDVNFVPSDAQLTPIPTTAPTATVSNPTATNTATATNTPTNTPTTVPPTATDTATATEVPTNTPTATTVPPTATDTPTSTNTPEPSTTEPATNTPTPTITVTATNTTTAVPTTAVPTTALPTTAVPTVTETQTPTATVTVGTITPSETPTATVPTSETHQVYLPWASK
ncbi:MAG TPA: hypothetical protein DEF47_17495 [Herpetosiphon sp.]|uniref:Kelch repeat-containing protein n=1 Tax=Herpetosiphon aurantiacus (strain ATCC 23779 / DSM 785 / 114-95) TaxID=316274 RepID=A9AYK1_HERA2|nr:kelch repeat-containing protein [Herpetosiphon sp.]ABX03583.1 Kelch repeat-containing protein [Herpetosiphon aurantiacus DSM 785]HBW51690.1 hypothetical protein [Herpetosiphon sp.]